MRIRTTLTHPGEPLLGSYRLDSLIRGAGHASRLATCPLRAWPSFLILGTQKGGTTSFYDYLTQHPDIGEARVKEVNYFNKQYDRGARWYRSRFPLGRKGLITGEATPDYLFLYDIPRRVKALLPDLKFIVLLREPADRAYSMHRMCIERNYDHLDFPKAVAAEQERIRAARKRSDDPTDPDLWYLSYFRRGLYAEQLERWFAEYPRDRFLVLRSEDLFADPQKQLDTAFEFLGVRPYKVPDLSNKLPGRTKSADPEIEETLRLLRDWYIEPNERLSELLDEDWTWSSDESI